MIYILSFWGLILKSSTACHNKYSILCEDDIIESEKIDSQEIFDMVHKFNQKIQENSKLINDFRYSLKDEIEYSVVLHGTLFEKLFCYPNPNYLHQGRTRMQYDFYREIITFASENIKPGLSLGLEILITEYKALKLNLEDEYKDFKAFESHYKNILNKSNEVMLKMLDLLQKNIKNFKRKLKSLIKNINPCDTIDGIDKDEVLVLLERNLDNIRLIMNDINVMNQKYYKNSGYCSIM